MQLQPKSNIANKVRNTKLPKTRPLMPLFEVVSNSIHAINEAKEKNLLEKGEIKIKIIRNGDEEILKQVDDIDSYPIKSFEITDNGIGLNDDNLNCFIESDTDHKIEIGGKGVGRFVCLKAFDKMLISSCFMQNGSKAYRRFEFKATKEGFHNFQEANENIELKLGTKIVLSGYKEEYGKNSPRALADVARELVFHFQLYFITDEIPHIEIRNQNYDFIDLRKLFLSEFQSDVQKMEFFVADNFFTLYLTKSFKSQSHKLHFCAHNRTVREEGLANKIVDLGKYSIKDEGDNFYYQAFIVGDMLDQNVDLERVGFNFPIDEDDEKMLNEISLAKIRSEAISSIEVLLSEYLTAVREEKLKKYRPTIYEEMPQYRSILNHKVEEVKKLPPNLPKDRLDIELYRIEQGWKAEVKEKGYKLVEESKDITNLLEYKDRYESYISEFNELGKSELARYIIHRKSVIELLEYLINQNDEEKFSDEDIIHSIFFPIRSSSDEIPHDKQNLWLIDERLTYHSFLASDRKFESIQEVEVNSDDRTDLLIYNDVFAFTENSKSPFSSFTIVEFKKPQRNDYQDYDPKKNPVSQTEKYIEALIAGKVKDRNGRLIRVDERTPFYVYMVCDITPTLEAILKRREFSITPDGLGYFLFKNKYYNAYFEVIPFEKVLSDAKKRNNILFDKLGIAK